MQTFGHFEWDTVVGTGSSIFLPVSAPPFAGIGDMPTPTPAAPGPRPLGGPNKNWWYKFLCKVSPAARVLASVEEGAAVGALRGAMIGAAGGEVIEPFGGGVPGAIAGGFVLAVIGAGGGVFSGAAVAAAGAGPGAD